MPHDTIIPSENSAGMELLEQRIKELEDANSHLEKENSYLRELLILAQHNRFGSSSEKGDYNLDQTNMFFELDDIDVAAIEPEVTDIQAYKRRKRHVTDTIPEGLPVETVEHTLPEGEQVCPVCEGHLHVMGREIAYKELKLIPAKAVVVEHVRYTYSCRNCERSDTEVPVKKAPMPKRAIKGSHAAPESVSHIMTEKHEMGVPLFRQSKYWERQGVRLSRQTMSNWVIKCADDWLKPLYELLHRLLLGYEILSADETTIQVLREPGKSAQSKSYMWLYRTGGYTDKQIVLMEYQPNREGKNPKKFLEDYPGGYLHTDAYDGYNLLPDNITLCFCWAHVRRKFHEAMLVLDAKDRENSGPYVGRNYCDKLFSIERRVSDLSPADKYQKRLECSKPVLDEFKTWLDSKMLTKSKFGEAIGYTLNNWRELNNFLLDGRLSISNNLAENSIRPFAISRKNFLFSNTPKGAEATAIIVSVIETAKANNLNAYEYIRFILADMPNSGRPVEDYLPWSGYLPEGCRCTQPMPGQEISAVVE